MGNFDKAYDKLLAHEGGYSNHANDRGGETYAGISRRFYPDWSGWPRIDRAKSAPGFPDELASDDALSSAVKAFYREHYWDRIQGDRLRQAIAIKLFDTSVNLGLRRTIRQFQEALNLLNRNMQNYDDITADGVLGSRTLTAMRTHLRQDGTEEHLLNVMKVLQGEHYVELMRRDPSQEQFSRGWMRRVLNS